MLSLLLPCVLSSAPAPGPNTPVAVAVGASTSSSPGADREDTGDAGDEEIEDPDIEDADIEDPVIEDPDIGDPDAGGPGGGGAVAVRAPHATAVSSPPSSRSEEAAGARARGSDPV